MPKPTDDALMQSLDRLIAEVGGDKLVLRMQRPLKDKQVDALNDEFASLVKKGRIEQGAPLKNECDEHPELPRLYFDSTKRDYGTTRMLINRINEYDIQNAR